MDRGGFLELFGFPEGLRENAKRQAGALGVAWPDRFTTESRECAIPTKASMWWKRDRAKSKNCNIFHKNSRLPRRFLRFFATFSGNRIGLPQDKYTLNMGAQSY
jgi:hypothetical protein